MNNQMVAHAWAHGNTAKGSNYHTDGIMLTSYYTPIATKIDDIIYITSLSYSVSTSKHINYARNAVNAYSNPNVFYTPAFDRWNTPRFTHEAMLLPCVAEAIRKLDIVIKSNKRQQTKIDAIAAYMDRRQVIIDHAVRVGVTLPEMPVYAIDALTLAEYSTRQAEIAAAAAAARDMAIKKQQLKDKKQYAAWIKTGTGSCPASYRVPGADVMTIKGDMVITGQGAECPVLHAVIALRFWNDRHSVLNNTWETYHTNGHKIHLGMFTLDSIAIDGTVKAGCHTFTAKTIMQFIKHWSHVLQLGGK